MIGLYLAAFLFGAVLVGAALVGFGDKDADAGDHGDHGDHAGHDGKDVAADAHWLPFLSLRFWSFGAASFGLTGLLVSLLPVPWLVPLALALIVGLSVGTGTSWLFRRVRTDEVSGETSLARYAGEEARVVVTVRPGSTGRIAVDTSAGRVEIPAKTRDRVLAPGERVLVASVAGGVADVSPLAPERHPVREAE